MSENWKGKLQQQRRQRCWKALSTEDMLLRKLNLVNLLPNPADKEYLKQMGRRVELNSRQGVETRLFGALPKALLRTSCEPKAVGSNSHYPNLNSKSSLSLSVRSGQCFWWWSSLTIVIQ